jgi:uncharacterized phiE125 gp8 family phage protein
MTPRVTVIVPPQPILSWDEARAQLALEADDERREFVEALVDAATAVIDGPSGWLGRAIGPQTLEARLDNFGCGSIRLPYPPLIEVLSVQYLTPAGAMAIVDPAVYELHGSALVPIFGKTWPSVRWQREAVSVRYRAGYDGEPGRYMPAQIKAAIKLMVGDLFRNRDTTRDGVNVVAVPMSTTVDDMLAPLRVYA